VVLAFDGVKGTPEGVEDAALEQVGTSVQTGVLVNRIRVMDAVNVGLGSQRSQLEGGQEANEGNKGNSRSEKQRAEEDVAG